jgi:hypothetical protein
MTEAVEAPLLASAEVTSVKSGDQNIRKFLDIPKQKKICVFDIVGSPLCVSDKDGQMDSSAYF